MFSIGDLVICRCQYEDWYTDDGDKIEVPAPNKIYTVREIQHVKYDVYTVRFEEIKNIKISDGVGNSIEPCFESGCFDLVPEADLTELKKLL